MTLIDSTIENCHATAKIIVRGGAFYADGSSTLTLVRSPISTCSATIATGSSGVESSGGGISAVFSHVTLDASTIRGCAAKSGGALYMMSSTANLARRAALEGNFADIAKSIFMAGTPAAASSTPRPLSCCCLALWPAVAAEQPVVSRAYRQPRC